MSSAGFPQFVPRIKQARWSGIPWPENFPFQIRHYWSLGVTFIFHWGGWEHDCSHDGGSKSLPAIWADRSGPSAGIFIIIFRFTFGFQLLLGKVFPRMCKSFAITYFGENSSSYRRVRRAWWCLSRTKECAEFGGSLFEPTSVTQWGVFSRTDIIVSLLNPWLTDWYPSGFPDLSFHPSRSAGPYDPAERAPPNEHITEHCYSDPSPKDNENSPYILLD